MINKKHEKKFKQKTNLQSQIKFLILVYYTYILYNIKYIKFTNSFTNVSEFVAQEMWI